MIHSPLKVHCIITAILAFSASFGCSNDDIFLLNQNCQSKEKPNKSCECQDNEWICPENACDEDSKPDATCKCKKGEWICTGNSETCPLDCPDDCYEVCLDDDDCSMKCYASEDCTDPEACPPPCPDECPDECTDGICHEVISDCPEDCPNDCDDNHECHNKCPDECPSNCDDDGVCPVTCDSSCTTTCDKSGNCLCSDSCVTSCDENGLCLCPDSCTTTCDKNGLCQCPDSCTTNCDSNGTCQCPAICAGKCDSNGVCPPMCGNEIITGFKFKDAEVDILVPEFSMRTSASSTLIIETENGTYDLSNAPCKDSITLNSSDTSVITVEKTVGCKFASVSAGTATCTAALNGTDKSATVKIHVVNPNKFKSNLGEQVDGKYVHVYRYPMTLYVSTRVSQGFDFYLEDEYMYFTQLKSNVKLTNGTTLDHNDTLVYKTTPPNINTKPITFRNAGHGQNLSVERRGNKDYIWVANFGTLIDGKFGEGYKQSQALSRVEFEENKTYFPSEIPDLYYYSDKSGSSYYYTFEPILDQKNNQFGFRTVYNKDGKTYVKIFNLDDLATLTPKPFTLPRAILTYKTDSNGKNTLVTNKTTKVTAKDLAELKPVINFGVSSLLVQGLELENGLIYVIGGCPEYVVNSQYLYKARITLRVYTTDGKQVGSYYLRTSSENDGYIVHKDLDGALAETINGVNYYNVGYYEPEGIRAHDGKVYISMSVHQGYKKNGEVKQTRRQMVFVYDLTEK